MHSLHGKQKKILEYLLDHNEGATLDELANYLEITKSAAKEHILKVESLGFLNFKDSKGLIGRPRRRYLLSQGGYESFPRQYSWLSTALLELLAENLGSEGIAKIMRSLARKTADSMHLRFQQKTTSAELLSEVTLVLNELGYRANLKQSDLRKGAIIEATNCVYHSVAKVHPELCAFDIEFIENATGGMNVKLESCIARGGAVCRFCIRKKTHSA